MLKTVKAVVKEGRIEMLEQIEIPEGTEVLVTVLNDEPDFWLRASDSSLALIWDNKEDDVYEQLLQR